MDKEIVQYHYDELIKSLVTLASPAEKQKYIMGYGHVGDGMIIEFESHYKLGFFTDFFLDKDNLDIEITREVEDNIEWTRNRLYEVK